MKDVFFYLFVAGFLGVIGMLFNFNNDKPAKTNCECVPCKCGPDCREICPK